MQRITVLAALAMIAAGCTGATAPSSNGSAGAYALTSIDGNSLPAMAGSYNVYVNAGALRLSSGGGFAQTSRDSIYNDWDGVNFTWRVSDNTDRVGTWRADGSVLTLTDTTGGQLYATQIIGTIAPHTILVTWDAGYGQYRYER